MSVAHPRCMSQRLHAAATSSDRPQLISSRNSFEELQVKLHPWPSRSPNLSMIESCWAMILSIVFGEQVHKRYSHLINVEKEPISKSYTIRFQENFSSASPINGLKFLVSFLPVVVSSSGQAGRAPRSSCKSVPFILLFTQLLAFTSWRCS